MTTDLNVEVKDLSSYRVAAVGGRALTFEAGIQPLSITEQSQLPGDSLLKWAKTVGLGRDQVPGLFGLSIISGGWAVAGEFSPLADKAASQEFLQCLPVGQGSLTASDFVSFIGAEGLAEAENVGVTIRHTRPGLYAVARVKGPYSNLSSVAEELMTEWLPSSGFAYGNEPLLNLYLNDPDTTPQEDLLTDFCMPVSGFQQLPLRVFGASLQ